MGVVVPHRQVGPIQQVMIVDCDRNVMQTYYRNEFARRNWRPRNWPLAMLICKFVAVPST